MCTVTATYFASTAVRKCTHMMMVKTGTIVKFGAKFTRGFDPRMQQYILFYFLYICIWRRDYKPKILKVRQKYQNLAGTIPDSDIGW